MLPFGLKYAKNGNAEKQHEKRKKQSSKCFYINSVIHMAIHLKDIRFKFAMYLQNFWKKKKQPNKTDPGNQDISVCNYKNS